MRSKYNSHLLFPIYIQVLRQKRNWKRIIMSVVFFVAHIDVNLNLLSFIVMAVVVCNVFDGIQLTFQTQIELTFGVHPVSRFLRTPIISFLITGIKSRRNICKN